ncbi:hypothetical protein [Pseudomarimonas arenosa]|uniref:Uncharacterized protein n=1 Tax=Pseudomarimonas arenosa TaxID=2774145 RepID=A0AAW3ZPK4_9GAMM|nr:hypothetical protein [Pseudomarimonas arenosa]MBD8526256.1 hypothetical protein [Pseudomarimonas arenosa]
MNRLNRYFTLPLIFAASAVSAVVALGEPIEQPATALVVVEAQPSELPIAVAEVEAAVERMEKKAAHMRWLVTLPSARKPSACCNAPAVR